MATSTTPGGMSPSADESVNPAELSPRELAAEVGLPLPDRPLLRKKLRTFHLNPEVAYNEQSRADPFWVPGSGDGSYGPE